jgi:hypothetical protein
VAQVTAYSKKNYNRMSNENNYTIRSKNLFTRWIGYEWIVKNLLFFLFLTLLAVVYIANGHVADNTIRDINVTAKEVKNLQYEYKSLKSEEMFKSRESQIVNAAAPLGLKISNEQSMELVADNKEK